MNTSLVCCLVLLALPAAADERRDPTRPPIAAQGPSAPAAAPVPQLTAVFGTGGNRVAIVNGKVVRRGESVGPFAIEAVFADGVRYRYAGATHDLYLRHAATFKKPSPTASSSGVQ